MAANYLHGIETLEISRGARPIRIVKSAVIALLGTAPVGPVNAVTLSLNDTDGAQFGPGNAEWQRRRFGLAWCARLGGCCGTRSGLACLDLLDLRAQRLKVVGSCMAA